MFIFFNNKIILKKCHSSVPGKFPSERIPSWYYLAALLTVTIGSYYYSLFHADFIALDDMHLITRLLNQQKFELKDVIWPADGAKYYRPIVELSYQFDHWIWFDVASGYHLTNVILHVVNVFFVYLIAVLLFSYTASSKASAPFFSALLFAVNPLACEPVCWVSGRSDLIAAFFMLSSFACYLLYKQKMKNVCLVSSGILFMLAALTKEVALALPGVIVAGEILYYREVFRNRDRMRSFMIIAWFVILTMVYFFIFRRTGVSAESASIGVGQAGLREVGFFENTVTFFASIGFYVRKLLFPYPLNFAIHTISLTVYGLAGILILIVFLAWGVVLRRGLIGFLCLWVLLSIMPAAAAAALRIPWTPWAERYLYIPFVGFALLAGYFSTFFITRYGAKAGVIFSTVACLLFATTLQRNFVWADELRLWEDTEKKSGYAPVHYLYGTELLRSGREEEGIAHLKKAVEKGYAYFPSLALAGVEFNKGNYRTAENILKKTNEHFPNNPEVHKYLAEQYVRRASVTGQRRTYFRKALEEYELYVSARRDDVAVYLTIGRLYVILNQPAQADSFLKKVMALAPGSNYAIGAARLLSEKKAGNEHE